MITDEMVEKAKKSTNCKHFTIIDDDYIIIEGGNFEVDLIGKCEALREKGVNFCGPIEYREVDGKKLFLEHRAQGMEMMLNSTDFIEENYLNAFENYIGRLRKVNSTTKEQMDKFFEDIDEMAKEGIRPDPCHNGNLFYDEKIGFSFIDVYPTKVRARLTPGEIFQILLDTKFSKRGISIIPEEDREEYNQIMREMYEKITKGLIKYGYPQDAIKKYVDAGVHAFSDEDCLPRANIQEEYEKRSGKMYGKTTIFEIEI